MPDKTKKYSSDQILQAVFWGFAIGLVIIVLINSVSRNKQETDTSKFEESSRIEEQSTLKYDGKKEVGKNSDKLIQVYATEIVELTGKIGEAQEALGDFLIESPNILLWSDQDVMYVAVETMAIEMYSKQAKELIPPNGLEKTHSLISSAMEKYSKAIPIFRQGVDEIDPDKISLSADLMEEAVVLMWQVTSQLKIDAEALGY